MTTNPKAGRPPNPDLRIQRTEEILDAAAILFAERGFAGADTQELINRLQVGKGTLYRYFSSKQKLFLAAVDRVMQRLSDRVKQSVLPDADPLEQMAAAIRAYLEFFEEHPQFAELLIQERALFKDRKKPTYFEHQERNIGRWYALLHAMVKAGRLRDIPVEKVCAVVSDLVYGTMFTNYFTGRRKSARDQANDILDLVLHGVLSESERRQLAVGREADAHE